MKKLLFITNILLMSFTIFAQSKIKFGSDILRLKERNMIWTINGFTFRPSTDEVKIFPHINCIDTIYFQETRSLETIYDTVYSRIPNKANLTMILGCCDDMFDLIKTEDFKESFDLFSNYPSLVCDSIYASLLQFGKIKFEIKNKPISDTLICVFAGEFTVGQLITDSNDYGWIEPCRSRAYDNIIDIYIIKLNGSIHYETIKIKDFICLKGINIITWNVDQWPLEPEIILKKFGLRLFNNENVIIQYDYLTNELTLKFD